MKKYKIVQCEECGKEYEIYNPDNDSSPDETGERSWDSCDDCGGKLSDIEK